MCTDDGEGFYNSLKGDLQTAILNSIGSSKYAAGEIIKAWATLAFIAGDEHDNLEFIKKCVEWGKIDSCSNESSKLHSLSNGHDLFNNSKTSINPSQPD